MNTYEEEPLHFCCTECECTEMEIVDVRCTKSGDVLYAVRCKKCGHQWNSLQHAADDDALIGPRDFVDFLNWPPDRKDMEVKTIPCWAMGYLINGDPQGLTDEEVAEVDEFHEEWILVGSVHNYIAERFGYTDPPEQEAGFYTCPDIGDKAGYCEEWYCKHRKEEETNA